MSEPSSESVAVVLSTAPDTEVAQRIGTALVEERLVACANILNGVTSIYRWKGSVQKEHEVLMILKTTARGVEALRRRIVDLHPYDVPEVVALDVRDGHPPYLDWVVSAVGGDG
jgi:periplasmic divalent cation tolerance protein